MDIRVGDRVTYKYNDEIYIKIILDEYELSVIKDDDREILKIERPKYEVVEEKKELLTEEEKEFLKIFIKIKSDEILTINRNENTLDITSKEWDNSILTNQFKGLEINKLYTLKELGLE